MKSRLLLVSLLVLGGVLPTSADDAADEATRVELIEPHTLDVVFKGVKVGVRNFEAGEQYDVVSWSENTVTLQHKNQRFTLPRSKVKALGTAPAKAPASSNPTPPTSQAAASPEKPKATTSSQTPASETVQVESASQQDSEPKLPKPSSSAKDSELQELMAYVKEVNSYLASQPTSVRYARYARERLLDPQRLRPVLAKLLKQPADQMSAQQRAWLEELKSTFMLYSRGAWAAFERRMRQSAQAATNLP